jgi:thiol:disulfide interchange protein
VFNAIQQEEWKLLQVSVLDALYAGLPGLMIGFLVGYVLGASKSLSTRDRFLIALTTGLFGGVIITLLLLTTDITGEPEERLSLMFLLSILTTFGGLGVGAALHWEPFAAPPPKRHVTFDPEEDDEEFDRQIKEAMGG